MTPSAPTRSRKAQIDRTATALFRARGFAATSMRELATALGLEAGSLYSHIKSKEEILHRVCFGLAGDFFAGFEQATAAAPVAAQLRQAIEAHVRVLTRDSAASAVFLHEWRHLSEPARTEFLALRDRYEAGFRALIARGPGHWRVARPRCRLRRPHPAGQSELAAHLVPPRRQADPR